MQRERRIVIRNPLGLHLRPASEFVEHAQRYRAAIRVTKDGETVDGKRLIELLTLACEQGSQLTLVADGDDAEEAAQALGDLLERESEPPPRNAASPK